MGIYQPKEQLLFGIIIHFTFHLIQKNAAVEIIQVQMFLVKVLPVILGKKPIP